MKSVIIADYVIFKDGSPVTWAVENEDDLMEIEYVCSFNRAIKYFARAYRRGRLQRIAKYLDIVKIGCYELVMFVVDKRDINVMLPDSDLLVFHECYWTRCISLTGVSSVYRNNEFDDVAEIPAICGADIDFVKQLRAIDPVKAGIKALKHYRDRFVKNVIVDDITEKVTEIVCDVLKEFPANGYLIDNGYSLVKNIVVKNQEIYDKNIDTITENLSNVVCFGDIMRRTCTHSISMKQIAKQYIREQLESSNPAHVLNVLEFVRNYKDKAGCELQKLSKTNFRNVYDSDYQRRYLQDKMVRCNMMMKDFDYFIYEWVYKAGL